MNIKNGSLEETNFDLIIEIHVLILLKRIYLKSDIYIYIYIYIYIFTGIVHGD